MPNKHRKLSPSATSRWLICPKSIELCEGIERKESSYSKDGTEAHDLAENCLLYGRDAKDLCPDDEDRASAVQTYLDVIRQYQQNKQPIVDYTERFLDSEDIEDFGGTVDHTMIYVEDGKTVLHLFDYKHGVGIPVDAEGNKQLLSYFTIVDSHYPGLIDRFRGTIVQPRCFKENPIDHWEASRKDVEDHKQAVIEVKDRDDWVAGEHCRFCPAITTCAKVQEHAFEAAQMEFDDVRNDIGKLLELEKVAPAIKALLEKIDDALLDQFQNGGSVPGKKVIRRWSNRRWKVSEEELKKSLRKLRVPKKLYTIESIKTPSQLEKVLEDKKVLDDLVERKCIGHKVVEISARGEAVDLIQEAAKDFED